MLGQRGNSLNAQDCYVPVHKCIRRRVWRSAESEIIKSLVEEPKHAWRDHASHSSTDDLAHKHGPWRCKGQVPGLEVRREIRGGRHNIHHHTTRGQPCEDATVRHSCPCTNHKYCQFSITGRHGPISKPSSVGVAEG